MNVLLWLFLGIALIYWLSYAVFVTLNARLMPALRDLNPPEPAHFPRLTLIVPACNEAETLEAALTSKLAQDYPNLEIILINDRSTDATGAVMERMAENDPRIKVLHIHELPEGWLGKVHAHHQGMQIATGDWLLFSDADVAFAPGTLRKAVAYALGRGLEHLAVLPHLRPRSLWLDVAVALFSRVPVISMPYWAVEDPKNKTSAGMGAFNLVSRAAFARTPGFEWLRLEVGDDVGLGQMLKRSGARQSLIHGRGTVSVLWYENFGQMLRGTEKVWLASVGNYSPPAIYGFALMFALLEFSPFIALGFNLWLGMLLLLLGFYTAVAASRFNQQALAPSLLWPVGSLILVYSAVRAAAVAQKQGGLVWRGTLYKFEELRKGKRFRAF